MWKMIKALEDVIRSPNPDKRKALARAIEEYASSESFQFDFPGPSPAGRITTDLAHLIWVLTAVDDACRPDKQIPTQNVIRLGIRRNGTRSAFRVVRSSSSATRGGSSRWPSLVSLS
jgi:hypothetical protein